LIANNIAVLIPAYKPSDRLVQIIHDLTELHAGPLIVVDDGSGHEFEPIFHALCGLERVSVLKNAVNLGKGAALKAGINHALVQFSNLSGIVTADADGQHAVADILAVAAELASKPFALVMGSRTFAEGTPLRSRIGNNVSRVVYRGFLGLKLRDTQTGLRGLPIQLCKAALAIRSNRYEFETEMLSVASSLGLRISEVPIQTIYEDNNSSSHFDPFFDSLRIYFVVLRYGLASIVTSIVDLVIFVAISPILPSIIIANLASRGCALFVQFWLLKRFVFNSKASIFRFIAFVIYVAATGFVSGTLQVALAEFSGLPTIASKITVEVVIFIFNFLFLRDILFQRRAP
jgi:glycosyltransferase involved in cell wall biosynthesis